KSYCVGTASRRRTTHSLKHTSCICVFGAWESRRQPIATKSGVRGLMQPGGIRYYEPGSERLAKLIHDGIAAIASEVARGDLHAGRRLTPLVLGEIEQALDLLHRF